jgi:hypothetical protein
MSTDNKNTQTQQSCLTDVKCRFFAQYWGLEVAFIPSYPDGNDLIKAKVHNIKEIQYLELKPLSKIIDEEVKQLPNREYDGFSKPYESAKQFSILFDLMGFLTSEEADILKRLGFAIPFDKYSVEDLISFGWVRLS